MRKQSPQFRSAVHFSFQSTSNYSDKHRAICAGQKLRVPNTGTGSGRTGVPSRPPSTVCDVSGELALSTTMLDSIMDADCDSFFEAWSSLQAGVHPSLSTRSRNCDLAAAYAAGQGNTRVRRPVRCSS
jgi:hypothetical protein